MDNSTLDQLKTSSAGCPWTVSTLFTSILAVITTVTLVGNMLIAVVFSKNPSLRTSTNYYIVNMAVSDFLGPFFSWPLYVSEGMFTHSVFISGTWALAVCKLGMYFRAVSQIVSVVSLVLIALDRFVAIVFPFKVAMMNWKIRGILLLVSWLIALLIVLPYALFSTITTVEDQIVCRFIANEETTTVFHAIGIVLIYFIPLITIIVLYYVVMRRLKKRSKKLTFKQAKITLTEASRIGKFWKSW